MAIREIPATGTESLNLATELLQRTRLAHSTAGVWEAADFQWSSRIPRESDQMEQTFWVDDQGPVAAILITSSAKGSWQLDPMRVPGQNKPDPEALWNRTLATTRRFPKQLFSIPISDDDKVLQDLAKTSGLKQEDQDFTAWMSAGNGPEVTPIADGFTITDRSKRPVDPHPMADRNGSEVGARLMQCGLYDPALDLCIQTNSGKIAGYSLYWFDPVTRIGLIEPVRVHDSFQRKGLARAMVTEGISRLIAKGAERLKVSWETEAAGALYQRVGFQLQSTTSWYSLPRN